jgi:hypothetical protein
MITTYLIAWLGMVVLAVVNGAIRDFAYKTRVGDLRAHQISTLSLIILFAIYFWALTYYFPIESESQAWIIGTVWLVLTIVFEFGLGYYVSHLPLRKMLHDYNLLAGRVWIFILIWTFIGPYIFFALVQSHK